MMTMVFKHLWHFLGHRCTIPAERQERLFEIHDLVTAGKCVFWPTVMALVIMLLVEFPEFDRVNIRKHLNVQHISIPLCEPHCPSFRRSRSDPLPVQRAGALPFPSSPLRNAPAHLSLS